MNEFEFERGPNAFELKGKKLLRYFIFCFLYYEVYFAVYIGYATGDFIKPARLIRFGLTILLFYWLYQGSQAAKWITLVLYSIGSAIGIYYTFKIEGFFDSLPLMLLTACSLAFVSALIMSKPLNAFLAFQKLAREQAAPE